MYTLYISSLSPYSSKASALLGYAGIPCQLEYENLINRYTVLKRLTGQTMVPVLRHGTWAINDSTHIARWARARSERDILPSSPATRSICWLVEEFADEWMSRWVTYSRWYHREDADRLGREIGEEVTCGWPGLDRPVGRVARAMMKEGLVRGGVREGNRTALEQSRDRVMQGLENLFDDVDGYLFGPAPTVADFACYGQLAQYRHDPTGERRMEMYPAVGEWLDDLERMELPHPVVAHRHGEQVEIDRLQVIFGEFFGTYWRVLRSVHRARAADERPREVEVELVDGSTFVLAPSRYVESRLDVVLKHLNQLCREGAGFLGGDALQIESAIERAIEELSSYEAGARLLDGYDALEG